MAFGFRLLLLKDKPMKKLSVIFCLFLSLSGTYAQVTLEHTYNYSAAVVKFETLGYKYYLMDVPNSQCRIYNPDHSLFRTINCNVPVDSYLADIQLLSEKLFDHDEGIELVYTWYRYVPTTDSYYYIYGSSIINEDSSTLENMEGARYIYLNKMDEETWKLIAYCYDYSVWPERIWTNIYSLAGVPVVSAYTTDVSGGITVGAFPNPAENRLKVTYQLPEGASEGTLFFFSSDGKMAGQFRVDTHTDHLLLDVSGYKSGVYHYFVEHGNRRSKSGNLVVN
jgi:hypothetical protein